MSILCNAVWRAELSRFKNQTLELCENTASPPTYALEGTIVGADLLDPPESGQGPQLCIVWARVTTKYHSHLHGSIFPFRKRSLQLQWPASKSNVGSKGGKKRKTSS